MSIRLLASPLAMAAAAVLAAPASAGERSFTVTNFERIRIDGPYMVRLTTGVPPFARASGSPAAIDGVSVEVQGRTLVVRKNPNGRSGYPGESPGPVEISLGTHDLAKAWLNGAGSLAIDEVKGQTLELSIQGAGSMAIGRLAVDQLKAGISGSGSAMIAGSAATVTASARGTSTFDGSALTTKDATLNAEGKAVVKLTATNTAKVGSFGTATVELAGEPSCTVRAVGSAIVKGCR